MNYNYHTHHELCQHAEGTAEDYVKEAIKQGFKGIGISDHTPNPYFPLPERGYRMQMNDLPNYLKDVKTVKERYKEDIKVYTGLEVEYFPGYDQFYQHLLSETDYFILGQHYISDDNDIKKMYSAFGLKTKEQIHRYKDYVVEAINTGYFDIVAHPELYLFSYQTFDQDALEVAETIAKAAKEHNVLLEYNANGYRKKTVDTSLGVQHVYPRKEFWQVVKRVGAKTILSSDCHLPEFLYDDVIKRAEKDYHALQLIEVEQIPSLEKSE